MKGIKGFQKGKPSWNKGLKIGPLSEETKRKIAEHNKGNKYAYKGEGVSYRTLHAWLRMNKTKVDVCELCGSAKNLEIANIMGHKYSRDLNDYMWLCTKYHIVMDGRMNNLIQFREG